MSSPLHPCASHGCDGCSICRSGRCCMAVHTPTNVDRWAEALALDAGRQPSWADVLAADAAPKPRAGRGRPEPDAIPPTIIVPPMERPAPAPAHRPDAPLALPPGQMPAPDRALPPGQPRLDPLEQLLNHRNQREETT